MRDLLPFTNHKEIDDKIEHLETMLKIPKLRFEAKKEFQDRLNELLRIRGEAQYESERRTDILEA